MDKVEVVDQVVPGISTVEVRTAMERMKSGQAVSPDDILVEALNGAAGC